MIILIRGLSTLALTYILIAPVAHASPDKKICFASVEQVMKFEDEGPCLTLARDTNLPARDRAQILFQVGLARQGHWREHKKSFDEAWQDAYGLWLESIKADPTYTEPYLSIALLKGFDDKSGTIEILDKGLSANPTSARLKAFKAAVMIGYGAPKEMGALCDDAVKAAPEDSEVTSACGDVYSYVGRDVEALASFENAAKTYNPFIRRRYGLIAESNPYEDIAELYSRLGDEKKAAEALKSFGEKYPNAMDPELLVTLAHHQEGAGEFKDAVESYRKAFEDPRVKDIGTMIVPFIFTLARAGESAEALQVSETLVRQGNRKAILKVQVRLKNTVAPYLAINGTYDEATRQAMKDCIKSKECEASLMTIPM